MHSYPLYVFLIKVAASICNVNEFSGLPLMY